MKIVVGLGAIIVLFAAALLVIGFLSLWYELWQWIEYKLGVSWIGGVGYMSIIWIPLCVIIFVGAVNAYEKA